MKRLAVPLVFCLALGLLVAGQVQASPKTHDMKAEIVSVDLKANTMTVKDEKGTMKTVPVLEQARESMTKLKAGDMVMLSCMDNDTGEHQGVSAIKVVPVAKTS